MFAEALVVQDGRCAICSVAMMKTGTGATSVTADHCHKTGAPRKLLCNACNRGIGCLGDDPERVERALIYLRSFLVES